jgi:glycosyltransferase involved in cell wall biosynthesis
MVINRFAFGGAEQLVVDTVNEMYERGIDVRVVTVRAEGGQSMKGDLRIPAERVSTIPFRNLFDAASYLIRLFRSVQPSTIIMHLWFANSVGRIAIASMSLFTSTPTIITFEENVYDNVKTPRQFLLDRLLQRFSNTIIAVSESVRISLEKHGITNTHVVVLLNAIDTKQLVPHAGERDALRGDLGLQDDFTYLFVGRLIPQKGADTLIRAFAQTKRGRLLIVGDGVDRASLVELAEALKVADRVRFLGARRDLRQLFAASDCFVMPSRWEGFSIVLLQALAGKMPVIATDYGSVRDVIRDTVSGIIVPIDDIRALSSAMERVESDADLCSRLRSGAQEDISRFSIEAHVDTLLKYVS